MTIREIYLQLSIPIHLQRHMLLVTKIALYISKHWKDQDINHQVLLKATLLHDVGNIVKFDFKKYPQFLEEERSNIEYWIKKQNEMIQKYGHDDHIATKKMLEEFNIDTEIVQMILNKSFSNSIDIKNGNNWTLKVMLYSDLRVAPTGIQSLQDRLIEAMHRLEKYKGRFDLMEATKEIETQIQKKVDILLSEINEKNMEYEHQALLETQV